MMQRPLQSAVKVKFGLNFKFKQIIVQLTPFITELKRSGACNCKRSSLKFILKLGASII